MVSLGEFPSGARRSRRMRRTLALGLSGLLASCSCAGELSPIPAPAQPEAVPIPSTAPYGIRLVRRESVWAGRDFLVSERHVFAGTGAAFERESGMLVAIDTSDARPSPIASAGARTLWSSGDTAV